MSEESFEATYYIDDGYAGSGGAPHHISFDREDIEGLDEGELKELFWKTAHRDMEDSLHPYSQEESSFIEWATSEPSTEDE